MTIKAHDKYCVALEQLETALRLYQAGDDLYSVITLAGAAEEILGKQLSAAGGEPSVHSLATAAAEIHKILFNEDVDAKRFVDRANTARNALKHLYAGGAPTVSFDAREEAIDMLNRAIDNFWMLKHSLTPSMESFSRASRAS